jgi:NAD+ synthase (glutamine-hydrolysing)
MIFDGGSCAVAPTGELLARAASFREDLLVVDTNGGRARCEPLADEMGRLAEALTLGLRDYVTKGGFRGVVVGLDGGPGSAVAAALAADAVGSQSVRALALPSRHSSDRALACIRRLAENLGLALEVLPVEPVHRALSSLLGNALSGQAKERAATELPARVCGGVLAACASACGCLVLASANKTDLALGRCTPADSMLGALAPIGDLFQQDVLRLARHVNAGARRIPEEMLTAAPEKERGGDGAHPREFSPRDRVDGILRRYIEEGRMADQIAEHGFDSQTVYSTIRQADRAEHKRKQAPVVLKVSSRAFGAGRRMPVARRCI